ncbi:hypothetical protein PoB_006593600 [Plakobranchus ocellatus]|uniref:Uncharacterized protein n=1 Tax=Plakobranchus ocellatus TaxID=259542 RepID=A0AAV4D5J6_9GAST|nr:hypothetical protein PoB_006593600 [Plakobranchus ocellatus]
MGKVWVMLTFWLGAFAKRPPEMNTHRPDLQGFWGCLHGWEELHGNQSLFPLGSTEVNEAEESVKEV